MKVVGVSKKDLRKVVFGSKKSTHNYKQANTTKTHNTWQWKNVGQASNEDEDNNNNNEKSEESSNEEGAPFASAHIAAHMPPMLSTPSTAAQWAKLAMNHSVQTGQSTNQSPSILLSCSLPPPTCYNKQDD